MDIRFRPIAHTADEIAMGQMLWHYPIADCDAISATANPNGFTPLTAIDREYGWSRDVIAQAADQCNRAHEVCVVSLRPTLFLVPATKGKGNADFLVKDLFSATRTAKVSALHMTHFGFMQGHIPTDEISTVLHYIFMKSSAIGLNNIVFDIDSRIEAEFYKLMAPFPTRIQTMT
jgi:hypothetical protein